MFLFQDWPKAYKALIKSQTALRKGIDNTPTDEVIIENLKQLWSNVIAPLERKLAPKQLLISSGYRCLELNRAIKSKDTSQHTKGQAFDFECHPIDNRQLFMYMKDHFEFDQLILEFHKDKDPFSGWVHCSWVNEKDNRNKAFEIN